MTLKETVKLEVILGKLEALQNQTKDERAKDGLGRAKDELMRVLRGN